jgi:hypothetical protein
MKPTYLRASFLLAVIAGLNAQIFAQEPRSVPIEYLRPMKNSVSVGVRMVGGAKVKFGGNLGGDLRQYVSLPHPNDSQYSVPVPIKEIPLSADAVTGNSDYFSQVYASMMRTGGYISVFDNGSISVDAATGNTSVRPDEPADRTRPDAQMQPGTGKQYMGEVVRNGITMLQYDEYSLDTAGNTIPDPYTGQPIKTTKYYVPYDEGSSRAWTINSREHQYDDTTNPGSPTVTFGRYWSEARDNTLNVADSGNAGVEFTGERIVQRFKRFEWGVAAAMGISEFNAKTRRAITVNLRGFEYQYTLNRPLPDAATGGPTFSDDEMEETTVVIGDRHDAYDETTDTLENNFQGGGTEVNSTAEVNGYWQVRGVYYTFRAGPFIRVPLTRKFSVSASAGYMGAYVGSKFRYEETMRLDNVTAAYTTGDVVKNNQQYVSGCYADLNVEWWVSTRTGFYAGAAYEKMGDYKQVHDGRRAEVKMDGGTGLRFGIITRF